MNSMVLTVWGVVLTLVAFSASGTVIRYQALDLADLTVGEDLWQYRYDVSDWPAAGFGFDLFFGLDEGYRAGDLSDAGAPNGDWTVTLNQPDPNLPDDGRFYAEIAAAPPTLPSLPTSYFSVNLIWSGSGSPGRQDFVIYDATFDTLETGRTQPFDAVIPEPGVPALLLPGLFALYRSRGRRGRRRHSSP